MTVKVPPENAVVWVCGKFPGRIHKKTDGTCYFASGVPRHQGNRYFRISEILWEESRKRWYTMDPNAKPITGNAMDKGIQTHVTLEQAENARTLLREGMAIDLVVSSLGMPRSVVIGIRDKDKREFWEGK
jgi:hypothetical protein